ncbi:Prophage minor tail protein Z (GPZ) [Chelatococcus sambhunathii]|uniref:Prophage minor tail protein Z (GPZ) n=1 Tax=Chelatococcus sambhunathii TaxID=363953 RepID=A0ABP2AAP9_9HYPH|nr:phage tail protein [Chelatococcus sambhunathii]CUA90199.1 Prophage minor tail protein Z (GPZ) [Chelatococcus sambhunathii]
MSVTVRVTDTFDKLERAFRDLVPVERRNAAYARAINKAVAQARTQWVRFIVKSTQLPYGYVRSATVVFNASAARPTATLTVSGRYLTLFRYALAAGGKPFLLPSGVVAGRWGMHRGAFIAKMPNGHIGVFARNGKKMLPPKGKRDAIKQLYGPSVPRPLLDERKVGFNKDAAKVITDKVGEVILPLALHEIGREIDRVKARHGV